MTDIRIDRPEEAKIHKTQQKNIINLNTVSVYIFQKTWKKK